MALIPSIINKLNNKEDYIYRSRLKSNLTKLLLFNIGGTSNNKLF